MEKEIYIAARLFIEYELSILAQFTFSLKKKGIWRPGC
jgi:hypothetical protein